MTVSLDILKPEGSAPTTNYDAVVVGAGPYGLSTAAHLLGHGLKVAVFGKTMGFWHEHMPKTMLLRSFWWASNLSDPEKRYGIERYLQEQGQYKNDPLPIGTFIDYGHWFQKHAVPIVDETYISTIARQGQHFTIKLVDGRVVQSSIVVMASGLYHYTYRPDEYTHLAPEFISHTSEHIMFDHLAGKRVVVIGGGQSALETSALLREAGVAVQLVARRPLYWLPSENTAIPFFIRQLRYPKVGLGFGWRNWALEHYPYAFTRFSRSTKDRFLATFHGPAGAWWLKERIIGKLPIHIQQVAQVEQTSGGVKLKLANNTTIETDHIMLATGYRADIKLLPMLHPSLLTEIQTYMGSPILNNQFESSIPGLYFAGFSAARSFGPLYRFVVGADASARRVANSVKQHIASGKL
jgi:cation diffusion facilitator CzcD-associated flavoprotein CzcO